MKTGSTQKDVGLNFQHLLHFSRGKPKKLRIISESYLYFLQSIRLAHLQ